jgi:hypothetical protein
MRRLLILLLLATQGCALAKEKVGDYVTEAAIQSVEQKIDKELHKRDLSIAEAKALADRNQDGKVTKGEVMTLAKDMAKDYVDIKVTAWEAENKAKLAESQQKLLDRFTAEGRAERAEQKKEMEAKLDLLNKSQAKRDEEFLEKAKAGTLTKEDVAQYEKDLKAHSELLAKQKKDIEDHANWKKDSWDYFKALFGAIIAYLLKQVWGAKKHGATQASLAEMKKEQEAQRERQDFLERLTQRDLNQNGHIGTPPVPPEA